MGEEIYTPLIERMTWSHSRLSLYHSCPYAWFLKYIKHKKGTQKFYASFGSFVHSLIEKFYKGELKSDELALNFVKGFKENVVGVRPPEETLKKYFQNTLDYFSSFERLPCETVDVEKKLEFEVDGIPIMGYADFIGRTDGGLVLVDHKPKDLVPRSDGNKKNSDEIDRIQRQMYIYAKGIKEIYGEFPKELWINCYRFSRVIKEPFDETKYQQALDWVVKTANEIKGAEDFDAKYNMFYCKWVCDMSGHCEAYKEEVERYLDEKRK